MESHLDTFSKVILELVKWGGVTAREVQVLAQGFPILFTFLYSNYGPL